VNILGIVGAAEDGTVHTAVDIAENVGVVVVGVGDSPGNIAEQDIDDMVIVGGTAGKGYEDFEAGTESSVHELLWGRVGRMSEGIVDLEKYSMTGEVVGWEEQPSGMKLKCLECYEDVVVESLNLA